MQQTRVRSEKRVLWIGAAATAVAAVLFPRLEAVKNEDVAIWELDSEARVLAPLIIVLTLALFALLGSWAWRSTKNAVAAARSSTTMPTCSMRWIVMRSTLAEGRRVYDSTVRTDTRYGEVIA